jgi:diadenosine tetraphosphate (Ap4A) HIT family hydrolase
MTRELPETTEETCPLCRAWRDEDREVLGASPLAVAIADKYPVADGHALVIPRRHVAGFFDLTDNEVAEMFSLARQVRAVRADGWNLGVNVGAAAGQTVAHVHLHIIPRRHGDCDDPRGGVRWVLPEHAKYWD